LKNNLSTVNYQLPTVRGLLLTVYCTLFLSTSSCGIYSFTGVSITAKNISITEFYNNTDLGPANLGQTFTNRLKDYMLQNTNLAIVQENGELQMDGIVAEFKISQVAPTIGSSANDITAAALTRLTITVKATYINAADDSMSFKDRSFSFFENVENDNPDAISEVVINRILDQIILDMFNASVANW
jgi:Lipopolysaccharide-assembly